jgi:hypothetical protein
LSNFGFKTLEEDSLAAVYKNSFRFSLPGDSGAKACLSRQICSIVKYDNQICLWILERGVFPNHENLDLFDGYRKSLGELRKVDDAPCHIVFAEDSRALESLLDITLYFIWDAVVFDPTQEIGFYVSHDEMMIVYAKNESQMKELERILKSWKNRDRHLIKD